MYNSKVQFKWDVFMTLLGQTVTRVRYTIAMAQAVEDLHLADLKPPFQIREVNPEDIVMEIADDYGVDAAISSVMRQLPRRYKLTLTFVPHPNDSRRVIVQPMDKPDHIQESDIDIWLKSLNSHPDNQRSDTFCWLVY